MLVRNIRIKAPFLRAAVGEIPPADSFFFRVFESNIEEAKGVLGSDYLQAMLKGELPPSNFGILTVLDAYYCYRAQMTLDSLLCVIDREKETELYALSKELYEGYVDYNKTFFYSWHIRTSESVNPTAAFEEYAEHEHHIMCSCPPIYTLVAMLPCYYLWYWFSDRMLTEGIEDDNLYKPWVEDCHSADSAYVVGNFIDSWQKQGKAFDEALATSIYTKSMQCERKVFSQALEDVKTLNRRG